MSCRNGFITFAAGVFERLAIEDADDAPAVADRSLFLEPTCHHRDGCAAAAEDGAGNRTTRTTIVKIDRTRPVRTLNQVPLNAAGEPDLLQAASILLY